MAECPTCGAKLRLLVQDAETDAEPTYECPNGHVVEEADTRKIQT